MSLARRARFLGKSAALWTTMAVAVLCMALGALGLLIAALIVWLSHCLGQAAALAIAGAALLGIAALTLGAGTMALHRRRARQPGLTADAADLLGFGLRMVALLVRRAPGKALLAAVIAGAVAEYLSSGQQRD
ncbi:MAG: hypothetical protein KGL65_00340 [Rhodospirillales bacterium]|nr:hypothetical protein [Rhodospirillales bacterium]